MKGFYRTSADPLQQAEAFRTNCRAVCAYAKSVGFKSSGASKALPMALLRRYRLISHLLGKIYRSVAQRIVSIDELTC